MPSLFIILEKKIPKLDLYVNVSQLSKENERLEVLAKRMGVASLMSFFSVRPEELTGIAEDLGLDVKAKRLNPPKEKWFKAEEGLRTVRSLAEAVTGLHDETHARLISELGEFERVLVSAQANDVRWHLGVDY
jgi:hypothetical protein